CLAILAWHTAGTARASAPRRWRRRGRPEESGHDSMDRAGWVQRIALGVLRLLHAGHVPAGGDRHRQQRRVHRLWRRPRPLPVLEEPAMTERAAVRWLTSVLMVVAITGAFAAWGARSAHGAGNPGFSISPADEDRTFMVAGCVPFKFKLRFMASVW